MTEDKDLLAINMAELLQTIANPIRLLVLCKLLSGRKNVSEMLLGLNISQSALSQHLTAMKDKKIIKNTKEGKFVYYEIIDTQTKSILCFLNQLCCHEK